MTITKQATAEKEDTNMQAETEQYSYKIFKNWIILNLNVPKLLTKTPFLDISS